MNRQKTIPFNKFSTVGNELEYVTQVIKSGNISGNGVFTKKCQQFFESRYRFKKALLTSSCTDALEMAAILCNIKPGDEVIMPSYTFVSTANAFLLRGAKIIFADSEQSFPNSLTCPDFETWHQSSSLTEGLDLANSRQIKDHACGQMRYSQHR